MYDSVSSRSKLWEVQKKEKLFVFPAQLLQRGEKGTKNKPVYPHITSSESPD